MNRHITREHKLIRQARIRLCLVDDNDTMDDYPKLHPRMQFEDLVKKAPKI